MAARCEYNINAIVTTVTCKVFNESTPMLLNQPLRKIGQSCTNREIRVNLEVA